MKIYIWALAAVLWACDDGDDDGRADAAPRVDGGGAGGVGGNPMADTGPMTDTGPVADMGAVRDQGAGGDMGATTDQGAGGDQGVGGTGGDAGSGCVGPNPEGCRSRGCPGDQVCEILPDDCIPSSCGCDEATGSWFCTEDCGGGRCVQPVECAGENPQGCLADGCPEGQRCEVLPDTCVPSACGCDGGLWTCTADCGGGTCVPPSACMGPNPQGCVNSGCPEGQACVVGDACTPSSCMCNEGLGQWVCTRDCGGGVCRPVEGPCGPNPAGCAQTGCPEGQVCEVVEGECRSSGCQCDAATGQWACTPDCNGGSCVAPPINRWYLTCGDPVCGGHREHPGVPRCADQVLGNPCRAAGEQCDPVDACNALYVCTDEDPRMGPCPISKAEFKKDIEYLSDPERSRLAAGVQGLKLAKWRYTNEGALQKPHLGFLIEAGVPAEALRPSGDQVDLYGYTTLAIAALQAQAEEIARLRAEVEALKARLDTR